MRAATVVLGSEDCNDRDDYGNDGDGDDSDDGNNSDADFIDLLER